MENEPTQKNNSPTVSWVMSQQLYDKVIVPCLQICFNNALNKDIETWYINLKGLHMAVGMFLDTTKNEQIEEDFLSIHNKVYDVAKNKTHSVMQNRQASQHKTVIWHELHSLQMKIQGAMHEKKMFFFGKESEEMDAMADWGV